MREFAADCQRSDSRGGCCEPSAEEIELSYFENTPQYQFLTDEWLTKVEGEMREALSFLDDLEADVVRKYPQVQDTLS